MKQQQVFKSNDYISLTVAINIMLCVISTHVNVFAVKQAQLDE